MGNFLFLLVVLAGHEETCRSADIDSSLLFILPIASKSA
jgi:hypothetical protein